MNTTQIVITGLLAIFAGAGGSVAAAWLGRPKNKAEAGQINAAAGVAVSQEARAWAQTFAAQAEQAQLRATQAEQRADESDAKAERAQRHIDALDDSMDQLESLVVQSYGYVRQLQESVRQLGGTPAPPPHELEELWSGNKAWRTRFAD